MPTKTISINESQLYAVVRKMVNEMMTTQSQTDADYAPSDADILYNAYTDNPGPISPIKGFNEKIAKELLSDIRWDFIQYEGIMCGNMNAEVEGTAADGNIAVAPVTAWIYADPANRTIENWTKVKMEDDYVIKAGTQYDGVRGAEVRINKDAIAKMIDRAVEGFVKGGGLDKYLDEDY